MTLSEKHKYIFLHIPKTGGTPIYKHLVTHFNGAHKQVHLKASTACRRLGSNIYKEYFKFTFIRNPFSRMVSWYFWILQEAKIKKEINNPGTFDNFIKNHIQVYSDQPLELQAYSFRENQVDFITTSKGIKPNYIGRFENLENEWKRICEILKFKYIKLDVYKKQDYGNYKDYYNDELIKIMNKRFKKDLDAFKYKY